MKLRILVATLLATAVALVPVPASAKGPTEVEITGPGLEQPIRLDRAATSFVGDPGPVGELTELTGVFLLFTYSGRTAFATAPPPGDLGPRYLAIYTADFDDTAVRQELYPFADGGPIVYTPSGQTFHGMHSPYGGWRQADPALTEFLISVGVPTLAEREGWSTSRDREQGLSISYPRTWQPAADTVAPSLIDPVIPIALGTYDFPTEGCGAVPGPALDALGREDAFIAVYVANGPALADTDFERPARFGPELPWWTGPIKCTGNVRSTVRTLDFQVDQRRLQVMVAVGPEASTKRQETVYRILDTLTVASPPNGPAL